MLELEDDTVLFTPFILVDSGNLDYLFGVVVHYIDTTFGKSGCNILVELKADVVYNSNQCAVLGVDIHKLK